MKKLFTIILMCICSVAMSRTFTANSDGDMSKITYTYNGTSTYHSDALANDDIIQSNGHDITIDAEAIDTPAEQNKTITLKGTGGGDGFTYELTGDRVLQWSIGGIGSTVTSLTCTHTTGNTLTVKNVTGGSESSAYGLKNSSTGTVIIDTVNGGNAASTFGVYNSTGTVIIDNATGGDGTAAHGVYNNSTGTVTIGTATGGSGSSAYGVVNNSTANRTTVITAKFGRTTEEPLVFLASPVGSFSCYIATSVYAYKNASTTQTLTPTKGWLSQ